MNHPLHAFDAIPLPRSDMRMTIGVLLLLLILAVQLAATN